MEKVEKKCIVCERNEDQIPLVKFDYKQTYFWICPQHIPVIIHNPEQLAGKVTGAENFEAG